MELHSVVGNGEVDGFFCPACNNEFQAIPVAVQSELATLRQRIAELEKAKMRFGVGPWRVGKTIRD